MFVFCSAAGRFARPAAFAVLLCLAASAARAQDHEESEQQKARALIRAQYTKYEFRIPMRDGAKLFTAVYVPKDAGSAKSYPFLIERTPYSVAPYGEDNYPRRLGPAPSFTQDGFIFVYQDVRGRYQSDGTFQEMTPHKDKKASPQDVDESSDTYDTMHNADVLVLVTEWNEFRSLDWARVATLMSGRIVVDLRNIYHPEHVAGAGFAYHSIGRAAALPME